MQSNELKSSLALGCIFITGKYATQCNATNKIPGKKATISNASFYGR